MKTLAAVTEFKGAQFELAELDIDDPREGEVLIEIAAAGICHSDIGARDQYLELPLPIVLGHEGAGVVVTVGSGVTKVCPGDHVVLSRLTCGRCSACVRQSSNLCERGASLNFSGARLDGSTTLSRSGEPVHGQFFGQSSFATFALAHERNCTPIDPTFDLTLAPAFGCGVLTGAGTVLNGPQPSAGSSIAVFGTGTVGLAAIMMARVCGYQKIVAIDVSDSRLDLASELGATHTIEPAQAPLTKQVHAIAPQGVAFSIDTTGLPTIARSAVDSLTGGGTCALIGVGPADQEIYLNHMQLAFSGVSVRGFPTGFAEPDALIPVLMQMFKTGDFPVDRLLSFYPFEKIEDAVRKAERGAAIKPILTFN
ncbi:NAD(P)-dependent alcohol dehydrogenase [Gordonia sp. HY285]|uniref:NAD(P)-dependent alcohol dehydrogenase n=1 Tax=Gordonia liuliyuniae TaxID=2911517 RepID=UPI001F197012|nr:NAD(P)-dependent alcohol dehydrogenase [Gordonia liuliyuniae]MCF8608935.1 NAD(P)-dependent alcohol dehydrogenase [Gordonia liuliyuniae]